MLEVKEIKRRYKKAQTHKEQWRSIYEEAYEYALPMRNLYDGYYEGDVPGQNKMKRVFDSTAIHSTARFANRIQSSLFPPQRSWCRLEPGNEIPADQKVQAQQALDFYSERMFGIMKQSGFDLAMGEFLLDLAVGTAVMLIQPGDDVTPIRYTAIPSYHITFEEGPNGSVDTVYRRFKRPFRLIQLEFPDANIPDSLVKKYEEDPTENVELLEATYTIDGVIHYCVMTYEGDDRILHRQLKSFPWVISRYMKASNERYGRGPILFCLSDIKTLNKCVELTLKNASISIGGVFTAVDDGVLNPQTISIVPGAVIGVSSNGGPRGPSLAPLPRSGDANLSQIVANDLRTAIKKTLMDEMGMIDLPLKVNGLEVTVVPISPLAMANNAEKLNEVLQFMQIAQQLGPMGQTLIKMDGIGDYVADQLGIPAQLRTTPQERQQIQQQMMQAAQAAAQAQGVELPMQEVAE